MAAPEVTSFTDAALEWQGEPGTAGNGGTWSVNEQVSSVVRQKGGPPFAVGTARSLWRVGAEGALFDRLLLAREQKELAISPAEQRDYWSRTFYEPCLRSCSPRPRQLPPT